MQGGVSSKGKSSCKELSYCIGCLRSCTGGHGVEHLECVPTGESLRQGHNLKCLWNQEGSLGSHLKSEAVAGA